jgi:hypothetical protein
MTITNIGEWVKEMLVRTSIPYPFAKIPIDSRKNFREINTKKDEDFVRKTHHIFSRYRGCSSIIKVELSNLDPEKSGCSGMNVCNIEITGCVRTYIVLLIDFTAL